MFRKSICTFSLTCFMVRICKISDKSDTFSLNYSNLFRGSTFFGTQCSSCTYDRTSGMHLLAGLAAAAKRRVLVKNIKIKKKLENVTVANALQLEAARRCAVPIRFNSSHVPSLKSLILSVAVL